ncbi:MAG: Mutator mutT protein [Candidatus Moranbacteria bacterium GW2011_GWE1_36_7]|nr:MAG: Mutator mutT protein [Candidatus Moranbacteria bacterium GW2011_GWD2_36_12]KKQ06137.1 MAG: Mutator mutT protein [Candidatus Moranbacteria bacterium GW2011_GWE2_36_40]KKQ15143.1 MAG: Mutator mutT protein [Candidatus Moranbacteria bacterium GW2011_GWE1_36_7]
MNKIIVASGPVIIEDGKTLLNISGKDNFWKFCGGRVEENETLQQTATREVKEEMGLEIEIINPTPFLLHTAKETAEGDIDVILVHYLAKRIGEIFPGEDIREWKWIPISELAELEKNGELAPNIIPTLKHFHII